MTSLLVQEVSKTFQDGHVLGLKPTTVQLELGEFLVIQGPSGAGKSTLLGCIAGLLQPTQGTISMGGLCVTSMNVSMRSREWFPRVQCVFQSMHLVPYLTATENLMAMHPDRSKAESLLDSLGMGHRFAHRPSDLSVGECQRVAVARALMGSPKLLLADEPTGNLDPENSQIVLSAFDEFRKSGGAVMMVTHDEVPSLADRSMVLG
ncbi:MAG: ATP-binding cassette domain-containing protein [Planctomycetes bacterium]|nr:ATP-binding cassette domain-containing protein [Planctomycetota bacterium]